MKFSEMPYERLDFEKVKAEFAELEKDLDAAKSGEEQFEVHKRYYKLRGHVESLYTIAHIRHDIDMTDEFYDKEHDFFDQILPEYENMVVSYQTKLYNSPYRAYLEEKIGKVEVVEYIFWVL